MIDLKNAAAPGELRAQRKRCPAAKARAMLSVGRVSFALPVLLASLLGIVGGYRATASAAPQYVIEDNDFRGAAGSDLQSVLPLLADPAVRVLGFTVVTGDDWENAEAAALLRFLEVAGRTDVPVFNGAVYPLINSVANWREREREFGTIAWKGEWGGSGSIDHVPAVEPSIPHMPQGLPTTHASAEPAAAFLIRAVHAHPHAVTIVAAGPLTNVALAIRLDPTFAATARQLVFMGGLIDRNMADLSGNAAFSEDFNLMFDPEAAHIALTANWPRIVSVGNVSSDVAFTPSLRDRIAVKRTPLTAFLKTYYEPLPMWDEVTTAIAIDPTLVSSSVDAYLDVDLAPGLDYGRVHVWPDSTAPRAMGVRKVTIVSGFDRTRFIDGFVRAAQALP
jgi:inosine-uridine nucleoside N-ribohydrolase